MTELAASGIPVTVTCRVLKLSRQPYYRWLADPITPSEVVEAYRANALFDAHKDDPEFGHRLLADEARDVGEAMADRTAWRIASANGWFSAFGKPKRGKGRRPGPPVHDDLCAVIDEDGRVRHVFAADAPNELWLVDITEHKTAEGKLYLCATKDVFSGRIVGYSIDSRMKSRLAVQALENAVAMRGDVAGCVIHSDRGSQFRSRKFLRALTRHRMVGSMGRVGSSGDNAAMEMLLSVSRGHSSALEQSVEMAGVVPLQAPHCFSLGLPVDDSTSQIFARLGVTLGARQDDGVEGAVELAVAAA